MNLQMHVRVITLLFLLQLELQASSCLHIVLPDDKTLQIVDFEDLQPETIVDIPEAVELSFNRSNEDLQKTPNASDLVYTARLKAPEGYCLFCNVHVLELNQNSTSFASWSTAEDLEKDDYLRVHDVNTSDGPFYFNDRQRTFLSREAAVLDLKLRLQSRGQRTVKIVITKVKLTCDGDNKFRHCPNQNFCISKSQVCNGVPNCHDNSDEQNCPISFNNEDGSGGVSTGEIVGAVIFLLALGLVFLCVIGGCKIRSCFNFKKSPSNYRLQHDATFSMAEIQDLSTSEPNVMTALTMERDHDVKCEAGIEGLPDGTVGIQGSPSTLVLDLPERFLPFKLELLDGLVRIDKQSLCSDYGSVCDEPSEIREEPHLSADTIV